MDIKITLGIISIAGILISALISSAAYFYKSRTEIKRSNRRVLYLLLEIRFSFGISVINPTKFTDAYLNHYVKRLESKGIPCKRDDFQGMFYELVFSHINEMLAVSRADIENRLLQPFEDALIELSNINPTLAYRLKGHEKLQKLLDQSKQYLQNTTVLFMGGQIKEDWLNKAFSDAVAKMEEAIVSDLYETLDSDIIKLSSSCGLSYKKECEEIVSSRRSATENFDFKDLDRYLDGFITTLLEAANKSIQPLTD